MKHTESYIDSSIEIPEGLPLNIMKILEMLSEYDKMPDGTVLYFDRLDDLCTISKNAIAANVMSKSDWKVIIRKYYNHADEVFDKEKKNENIQI